MKTQVLWALPCSSDSEYLALQNSTEHGGRGGGEGGTAA